MVQIFPRISRTLTAVSAILLACAVHLAAQTVATAKLGGRVIDTNGFPMANALVGLFGSDPIIPAVDSTRSNADGSFYFDSLVEKRYFLKATSAPYPAQWFSPFGTQRFPQYSVWASTVQKDTLRIGLRSNPEDNPHASQLTVMVLDTAGRPVKSGTVQLLQQYDQTSVGWSATDSSGAAVFKEIQPGNYSVFLQCPPYVPQYFGPNGNSSYAAYFLPVALYQTRSVTVRLSTWLSGSGQMNGIVFKPAGVPAPGVSVFLFSQDNLISAKYSAQTDTTGRFGFQGLSQQIYFLKLSSAGYPDQWFSRGRSVTTLNPDEKLSPTALSDTLRISLSQTPIDNTPSSEINIRVLDSNGTALPPSRLTAGSVMCISRSSNMSQPLVPGALGYCQAGKLAAGEYWIRFQVSGYPLQFFSAFGNTGGPQNPVVLKDRDTVYLETRLAGHFRPGDTLTGYAFLSGTVRDSFNDPTSGTVAVFDSMQMQIAATTTGGAGADFFLRVPAMKTLYCSAQRPGGMRWYWSPQGMTLQPMQSGAIRALYGDTVRILMRLPKQESGTFVDTSARAWISGRVVDSANRPLNCGVLVLDSQMQVRMFFQTVSTGQFGPAFVPVNAPFFLAADVGGARYFFSSSDPFARAAPRSMLNVRAGDSLSVTIRLPLGSGANSDTANRPAGVAGTVIALPDLRPVEGCRVQAVPSNYFNRSDNFNPSQVWSGMSALTDSTGYFVFRDLPAGDYLLLAVADSLNLVAEFYQSSDLPSQASVIHLDSSIHPTITIKLRPGAVVSGNVQTSTGPLNGATVNLYGNTTRHWYSTMTNANGAYTFRGVPAGTWKLWASHSIFMVPPDQAGEQSFTVTEGSAVTPAPVTMVPGGLITGTFVSPIPLIDSTVSPAGAQGAFLGRLLLYSDSSLLNGNVIFNRYSVNVQAYPMSSDGKSGKFKTDVCPVGTWRCVFQPWSRQTGQPNPSAVTPGLGWSVLGGDTDMTAGSLVTVAPFDTSSGSTLMLRRGYSVAGSLRDSAGNTPANYGVSVLTKAGDRFFCVAFSDFMPPGTFTVAGLIDGADYYINAWAEGRKSLFWAPDTVTASPQKPYRFSASAFVPLAITLKTVPQDTGKTMPDQWPISLGSPSGDTGVLHQLFWSLDSRLALDSCILYCQDTAGRAVPLQRVAVSANQRTFSWQETRTIPGRTGYVVVGKAKGLAVRSNSFWYDGRQAGLRTDSLWIAVSGGRSGVRIEWGGRNVPVSDSVSVYRRSGGGPWQLITRQFVWKTAIEDYTWRREDSGATYQYHVELLLSRRSSPVASFALDRNFFALQQARRYVGPYERYRTIQAAIDAAGSGEVIVARGGTYRENLNFKGKTLSLESDWDYGRPSVIDAGGGVAIAIPWANAASQDNQPHVGGFKIQNAATGIRTAVSTGVSQCLFVNVVRPIDAAIDSAGMVAGMLADPFVGNTINVWAYQCTFEAVPAGIVAAAGAQGISETANAHSPSVGSPGAYIVPVYSLSSTVSISHSIFDGYFSTGTSSFIPVKLDGQSSSARLNDCDLWRTSVIPPSGRVTAAARILTLDPQFTDTTWYFLPAASVLRTAASDGSTIGYDGRTGGGSGGNGPSAVTGVGIRQIGLKKIALAWNPSPESERIVRYLVARCPGDTNLFYVNQSGQWDVTIPKDSLFSVIDTFSTKAASFVDTTVVPGRPYLYVVMAVDSSGRQGTVALPDSIPIARLFVNQFSYSLPVKAQKWCMLGRWGADSATLGPSPDLSVFHWDETRAEDKLLSQYAPATVLMPCNGYWIRAEHDMALAVAPSALTELTKQEATLRVSLRSGQTGWNQIASPLPFAVAPSWLQEYGAWEWDPDSLGYRRSATLEPWKAYWVNCDQDTVVPLRNETMAVHPKTAADPLLWRLRLSLTGKGIWDPDNEIGVSTGAVRESREPPAGFGGAQLYFIKTGRQGKPVRLSSQYRGPSKSRRFEWQVGLSPCDRQARAAVTGVAAVPEAYCVFWADDGRIVDLRKTGAIDIPPHAAETFGAIVVTANPADRALYSNRFLIEKARPNPFQGSIALSLVVPYEWSANGVKIDAGTRRVSLDVFDLAGRKIAALMHGDVPVGFHTAVWRGENDQGAPASPGVYVIRLSSSRAFCARTVFKVR